MGVAGCGERGGVEPLESVTSGGACLQDPVGTHDTQGATLSRAREVGGKVLKQAAELAGEVSGRWLQVAHAEMRGRTKPFAGLMLPVAARCRCYQDEELLARNLKSVFLGESSAVTRQDVEDSRPSSSQGEGHHSCQQGLPGARRPHCSCSWRCCHCYRWVTLVSHIRTLCRFELPTRDCRTPSGGDSCLAAC